MVGPWMLSSQNGLHHGRHHVWAMDVSSQIGSNRTDEVGMAVTTIVAWIPLLYRTAEDVSTVGAWIVRLCGITAGSKAKTSSIKIHLLTPSRQTSMTDLKHPSMQEHTFAIIGSHRKPV